MASANLSRATVLEGPTRPQSQWTPKQFKQARVAADTGLLLTAADFVESVWSDDRVRGVMSTRTDGLLGLPLSFAGDEDVIEDLDGPRGDWRSMFPESELKRLIGWGVMLGVGIAQRVDVVDRGIGERAVPRLKTWHPRWLRQELAFGDVPARWFLTTTTGEIEIFPGDGQWIIYCPYGFERPWAEGAWTALGFAWVLKQFALHDRARHSEVSGSPQRVGIAPAGATESARRSWANALNAMARDTSVVLPFGYSLSLLESKGQTSAIYKEQIDWADKATEVTLAGQTITTEGQSGFSQGSIHERIANSLIRFTASTLSETVENQGLRPWAAENFSDPHLAPTPMWDIEPPIDKKESAQTTKTLGEAIEQADEVLAASGQRVDAVQIYRTHGVPLVELTGSQPPKVTLAPTDVAKVVLVNEARASAGLGPLMLPDGGEDPDGLLTVTKFDEKNTTVIDTVGVDVVPDLPVPPPLPGVAPTPSQEIPAP